MLLRGGHSSVAEADQTARNWYLLRIEEARQARAWALHSTEFTLTPFPSVWSNEQQRVAMLRDPTSLAHQPGAGEHALGSDSLAAGTGGGLDSFQPHQPSVPQTSDITEGLEVHHAHSSEGGDHAGQGAGTSAAPPAAATEGTPAAQEEGGESDCSTTSSTRTQSARRRQGRRKLHAGRRAEGALLRSEPSVVYGGALAGRAVAEDAEDVQRRRGEVAEIVEAAIAADRERMSEEDRQLHADARLVREAQAAAYKAELMVLSGRLKEAETELSILRPQLTAAPQSHAGDARI
ncbi:hypothetical protein CYMTET_7119 [Cymbomonas tetramitiformis]|uniref:Uncharacterized protein n=2 Tax=Cymbomonas tetramitiformis TaxID=36881 RepID=A0AAE0GW95_9CHLO|nr:hypothetical protein CYMTET_7119 [Cymbomonas tetramitiformis]